jgi:general secretion pathway protein N
MARRKMRLHNYAFQMAVLVLPLCAGATASLSAISDPVPGEQAESGRANASVPSNWSEPTTTVVQVTIPPPSPSAVPERALSANPLWAMPLKQFSVTRERPIFLPSRRPPAPVATASVTPNAIVPPKPKEPERPQLSLVGTISGDEEKFGIFVDQSTKAVVRLKVGEDFQGWQLRAVQGQEAALEKNQIIVILVLPQPGLSQPAIAVRQEVWTGGSDDGKLLPVASHSRRDRRGVRE